MSTLSDCFTEDNYVLVRDWEFESSESPPPYTTSRELISCSPYLLSVTAEEIYSDRCGDIMSFSDRFAARMAGMVADREWHQDGFDILATRMFELFNQVRGEGNLEYDGERLGFDGLKIELFNLGKGTLREHILSNGLLLPPPPK